MSLMKYFSYFRLCAVEILVSPGTVNSKISKVFVFLSITTMSGLSVVTMKSGGRVPPTLCLVTLDVCVAGVFGVVQTLLNIIQDAIMAVCVPSLVKTDHTMINPITAGGGL